MIDYRGFGKSKGKRSEAAMKKDAQHVYNKMKFELKYPENKIIIYGRSLGSGFAAKLASSNRPKMLILDAPYYSLSQLTNRFLPFLPVSILLRFKVRTDQWLKYCRCPIFIIHGTKDSLIPMSSSGQNSSIKHTFGAYLWWRAQRLTLFSRISPCFERYTTWPIWVLMLNCIWVFYWKVCRSC